jgi:hypothetical protein
MNEKRFEVIFYGDVINCVRDETGKEYNLQELLSILMKQQATINKQQDQISYWKHKVNSLLWILSQFDEKKVKELLKEIGE